MVTIKKPLKKDKRTEALFKRIESLGCSVVEYNGSKKPCVMSCKEHGTFVYVSMRPNLINDSECLCPICKRLNYAKRKMNQMVEK